MTNSNFRILVVDDEAAIATLTAQILQQAGFSARSATTPDEALEAVATYQPHLLITDVMMPNMSGVELALAVRKVWPSCKALMMTGRVDAAAVLAAALRHGNHFALLQKPVQPTALLRYVREKSAATPEVSTEAAVAATPAPFLGANVEAARTTLAARVA